MLKRKILILVLCLAFIFSSSSLLSCSCDDDKTISSLPQSIFVPTSNKDNITIGSVGNNEDNKADDKEHTHYWFDISVNKDTSSTNSVIVSGKCYECGDTLSKEVITLVDLDEWKLALSPSENKSFTENTGNTYTDYDESDSMSWRINNDTYTCEYFINSETKTSTSYMTNLFSGYSMMYGDFKYNNETKTYQYTVKDQMIIELGFANGRLFSYQSKSLTTGASTVNYYLNHNTRIFLKHTMSLQALIAL